MNERGRYPLPGNWVRRQPDAAEGAKRPRSAPMLAVHQINRPLARMVNQIEQLTSASLYQTPSGLSGW